MAAIICVRDGSSSSSFPLPALLYASIQPVQRPLSALYMSPLRCGTRPVPVGETLAEQPPQFSAVVAILPPPPGHWHHLESPRQSGVLGQGGPYLTILGGARRVPAHIPQQSRTKIERFAHRINVESKACRGRSVHVILTCCAPALISCFCNWPPAVCKNLY